MQSQQLLTESQVFEDEVLSGPESADHPPEEMPERQEHGKNLIGTVRIELFAKSYILRAYDVLARHRVKGLVLLGALGWELGESRKKIARQDDLYIKDANRRLRLLSNRRWRRKVNV